MSSLRIGCGSRIWFGTLVLAWAFAPGTVLGQDLAIAPKSTPRAMLADQFVRTAKLTLRGSQKARPDQIERTRILLDLALQLEEDDPELWRLRMELAVQSGNVERALQCISRYCNMRPDDDAAQLQLITSQVASFQTLDERNALLKKILDASEVESFTAPLRSRLASLLAQGSFESGDQSQFRRYLAMALRLDRTNGQAARMAYNLVLSKSTASAEDIATVTMQLLETAPFDANLRLEFARLLLAQGLYEEAAQQFSLANRIASQMDEPTVLFDWCLSSAAMGEFDAVLERLNFSEQVLAQIAAQQAANRTPPEEGEEGASQDTTDPVLGFPMDLEVLRLVTFHKTGFEAKAEGSFGRIRRQLMQRGQQGDKGAMFDLVWLAVLFDQLSDLEKKTLALLAKEKDRDEAFLTRVRAWMALNRGQYEEAAILLDPLVDRDPLAAYGLALCERDKQTKVDMLQAVIGSSYRDLAGLLAAVDLKEMDVPVEPTGQGKVMRKWLAQWPGTLRNPDPRVQPMVRLDLTIQPQRYRFLEPIEATLRLHNDSEVPLALGDSGAVPIGVLVVPSTQRLGQWMDQPPLLVDMGRQLTIDPNEAIEVTTRLDRSIFGALLTHVPNEQMGFMVTAFLNPRARPGQRAGPGWMGGVATERFLERYAYPPTLEMLDQWIAALYDPNPTNRLSTLSRLCQNATQFTEELNAQAVRIGEAIDQRFAGLEPYEQAWTAFFLVPNERGLELFSRSHSLARRSDDPMVRIAYLSSGVHLGLRGGFPPESPVILDAIRNSNSRVSRYAQALKAGIELDRQAFEQERRLELERRTQQRR